MLCSVAEREAPTHFTQPEVDVLGPPWLPLPSLTSLRGSAEDDELEHSPPEPHDPVALPRSLDELEHLPLEFDAFPPDLFDACPLPSDPGSEPRSSEPLRFSFERS